ncbi:MAG: hypothetical protein Q4E73_05600 [Lachnospiraceae bacterium]|nr:hypothetical protein [Lachnospiraceae bacterium]
MLQQFIHQSAWAFILEASVLIAVLSKVAAIIHYNRLIHETEQMSQLHTKWVKALKKRFDNYEQLKFKVENAQSFVDKYMETDRICGIKSRIFLRIPLVCSLFILLAAFQGREEWIFMTGVNLIIVFMMEELLIDVRESIPVIKANLILFIERENIKGNVKKRKAAVIKPRNEMRKIKEEVAVSDEKELLSQEEMDTFGQIMKEWWEF